MQNKQKMSVRCPI